MGFADELEHFYPFLNFLLLPYLPCQVLLVLLHMPHSSQGPFFCPNVSGQGSPCWPHWPPALIQQRRANCTGKPEPETPLQGFTRVQCVCAVALSKSLDGRLQRERPSTDKLWNIHAPKTDKIVKKNVVDIYVLTAEMSAT